MTLADRIRNVFGFAEKTTPPQDMDVEIGTGSDGLSATYGEEEQRSDTLEIADYVKMQENDGQVTALVKAVKLPIKATKYTIVDDEQVTGAESKELQFIKENLLGNPRNGGMEIPMGHIIDDMLRAMTEGFRTYEKVYDVYNGKIRLKKLAIRPNNTVSLMTNENGEYKGFRQRVGYNGKYVDVVVPAEKSLLVTFQKDKNWLYGESLLKPLYYHYDKKHKLYFVHYIASELSAVKIRLVKEKTSDTKYISALNAVVDKLGMKGRATFDETKATVEFADASNPAIMDGIMRMIEEQNTQMSKALMAGFIESSTGSYGSKAMVGDMIEFFAMATRAHMQFIEEHINTYVIPDLIDYNFGTGIYPKFKFLPVDKQSVEFVFNALNKMIEQGNVPPELKKAIVQEGKDIVGLDVDVENMDFTTAQVQPPQVQASEKHECSKKHFEEQVEYIPRELYPDEQKVNWAEYRKMYTVGSEMLRQQLQKQVRKQKDAIVSQYVKAIKSGNPVKVAQVKVELADDSYSNELYKEYEKLYAFGKTQLANELDKPAEKLNANDKRAAKAGAMSVVDKQAADLGFRLANVASATMDDQANGIVDATTRVSDEYDAFWDNVLELTVDMAIAKAINGGWLNGAMPFVNDGTIKSFRYSAVLDGRTTSYCKSLDWQIFTWDDPNFNRVSPPNHYNCRSRWIAVTTDEKVTGVPKGMPVQDSIDTFKDPKQVFSDYSKLSDEELKQQIIKKLNE